MDKFEREILNNLRYALNNRKLKADDLLEWSTSQAAVEENIRLEEECFVHLPLLGVYCAVRKTADKRF